MYPDPSECPPTVFNLWTPMLCEAWDVKQANPESENVALFRKHVLILSDRNTQLARFIEHWIAHMLHYPGRKPNSWIIFMSEEGAGKGTLVKIIERLIGQAKVKEVNNVQRSLLGTFNQAMLDGFLIVLDEASGKHLFDGKEELKNLITGDTVPVNQKGIKEKHVRSYARFMVTIQPRPVPTQKGDRRGVIVRCSDELIGNKTYWMYINAKMDTAHFIEDVHAYLMLLNPPATFQPDDLPQTEVQRELQAANADIFESWILDVVERWLSSGESEGAHPLYDYKGLRDRMNLYPEFSMQDMYRDFKMFADRSNALKATEGLTYQRFTSKFVICRLRKAFNWKPNGESYPKHKIAGVQHQCRRWDMTILARDLSVEGLPQCNSISGKMDEYLGRGVEG
eukprot:7376985-Prymnesium_polylepis.1